MVMAHGNAKTLLDFVNTIIAQKHGSLVDPINKHQSKYCHDFVTTTDQESIAAYFLLQMMSAVSFLHDRGIVHSDIKPNNWVICAGPSSTSGYISSSNSSSNSSSSTSSSGIGEDQGSIIYRDIRICLIDL